MDSLDSSVLTSLLFLAAHFLTAAGVWLYRRRRSQIADERDRVQKKTFTKWVNKHLIKVRKHITDLYEDLRDGHNLISLLEVLSGVTLHKGVSSLRRVCVSRAPPLILLGGDEEDGAQGALDPCPSAPPLSRMEFQSDFQLSAHWTCCY
ncbi:hypothetical protein JZ751_000452 [Albula glossodonta]|uniref:Calponin-homology (CH) domain-containing protein n=1 Tax=Albula glossodonta TaxID=121402 RepID=A0A8T2PWE8_9TELE|nr:hypothetical protein JZ751_000452 [Albula glossodonta]